MPTENDQEAAFSPNRKLCPDGSCIGVIRDDGKCSVCGTVTAAAQEAETTPEDRAESGSSPDGDADAATTEEEASSFDPNRRLCGDDTCIGVIGADGRCSVCGKPEIP